MLWLDPCKSIHLVCFSFPHPSLIVHTMQIQDNCRELAHYLADYPDQAVASLIESQIQAGQQAPILALPSPHETELAANHEVLKASFFDLQR